MARIILEGGRGDGVQLELDDPPTQIEHTGDPYERVTDDPVQDVFGRIRYRLVVPITGWVDPTE